MRFSFAAAAFAVSLAASPAVADDLYADDFAFNFMNDSSVTVTYFATINPDGQWSRNWLRTAVAAGTGLTLQFNNRSDMRCQVRTYVRFTDESYYDDVVDYCNKAVLTVRDDGMSIE